MVVSLQYAVKYDNKQDLLLSYIPKLKKLVADVQELQKILNDDFDETDCKANDFKNNNGIKSYTELPEKGKEYIDNLWEGHNSKCEQLNKIKQKVYDMDKEMLEIYKTIPGVVVNRFMKNLLPYDRVGRMFNINWSILENALRMAHLMEWGEKIRSDIYKANKKEVTEINIGDCIWSWGRSYVSLGVWKVIGKTNKRQDIKVKSMWSDVKQIKLTGIRKNQSTTYTVLSRELVEDIQRLIEEQNKALNRNELV